MRFFKTSVTGAALGAAMLLGTPALAMPLGPSAGAALGAAHEAATPLTAVQYRGRGGYRGGYRRGGGGAGVAAGLAAGAILGGIIASQAAPAPYYYGPPPARAYGPGDPAIDYCMRRFRSYDPYSMTYLGYDGLRHPCP